MVALQVLSRRAHPWCSSFKFCFFLLNFLTPVSSEVVASSEQAAAAVSWAGPLLERIEVMICRPPRADDHLSAQRTRVFMFRKSVAHMPCTLQHNMHNMTNLVLAMRRRGTGDLLVPTGVAS